MDISRVTRLWDLAMAWPSSLGAPDQSMALFLEGGLMCLDAEAMESMMNVAARGRRF